MVPKECGFNQSRYSTLLMRDVVHLLTTASDGELIQMQHTCNHKDTICHSNSSYVTTKLYGTSTCGCNNNTIFQRELLSRFVPSTYAGHVGLAAPGLDGACQSEKMATLLD